jgi:ParB-like chromosome segregation protein Spo0J
MGKTFQWKGQLKFHRVCELFPDMAADDYQSLKSHIAEHGLQTMILTFNNEIIDGRHRAKICQELDIPVDCEEWDGEEEHLLDYVLGENLMRRHLTQSQKGMIGAELERIIAAQIAEEKGNKLSQSHPSTQSAFAKIGKSQLQPSRDAAAEAAKQVGVNRTYVTEAKKIVASSPEIAKKIKSGELSITEGKKALRNGHAGNGDPGADIPRWARGYLDHLPQQAREVAWRKAVASAPDGNPTKNQVIEAVKLVVEDCKDPVKLADIQAEYEERRAIQDESDEDETWLEGLPLTGKLAAPCQRIYYEEALSWRWLSKGREAWSKLIATRLNKMRQKRGPMMSRFTYGLKVDPPEKWIMCPAQDHGGCNGKGRVRTGEDDKTTSFICPKCHGSGYQVVG